MHVVGLHDSDIPLSPAFTARGNRVLRVTIDL